MSLSIGKALSYFCPFTFSFCLLLKVRTAREFQERQTHTTDEYLIGTDCRRGRETVTTRRRNQIVLIHAVAADADAAHQHSILVQRHAARKNLNTVRQIWNRRTWLRCAGERREQIGLNQVQLLTDIEWAPFVQRSAEGTGVRIVDSVRKERAMQKPASPIGECHRAIQLQSIGIRAIDIRSQARGTQQR